METIAIGSFIENFKLPWDLTYTGTVALHLVLGLEQRIRISRPDEFKNCVSQGVS